MCWYLYLFDSRTSDCEMKACYCENQENKKDEKKEGRTEAGGESGDEGRSDGPVSLSC